MLTIVNVSSNSSSIFDTIDDLLVSLDITPICYIIYQLVLPVVGVIGFALCLINLLIFWRKKFKKPINQYYRLIASLNVFAMLFSVPYGLCFTPKYFPSMNSYACAIVQCIYIPYTELVIHFVGVLEIAILLERLKILDSYVRTHFRLEPWQFSFIFLLFCFVIDAFYAFNYAPVNGGDFFYTNKYGDVKQNTFYYLETSSIALTPVGSSFLIAIYVIKNVFTIIVIITLGIVAHLKMKSFLENRLLMFRFVTHPIENIQVVESAKKNSIQHALESQVVSPSINNQEKANKNHLFLILTLCCITISERILSITCDIYFLFSADQVAFILASLVDLVYVLGPALSFFVFYNFNFNFRDEYLSSTAYLHKKIKEIFIG